MSIFDALKTSGGSQTIFNTVKNVSQNQLLGQLQNNANQELEKLQKSSQSKLTAKLGLHQLETSKWKTFNNKIDDSLEAIENTLKRLEGIDKRLQNMLGEVNKAKIADEDPDVDFKYETYARAFDAQYRSLEDLAANSRISPNLLNTSSLKLDYPTSVYGAYNSISGATVTPSYKITDGSNKIWTPDIDSNLLRQYDEYPADPSNKVGNFYDGNLVLDSLDSSGNISFTIASNTVSPESFSGTMVREGIGILHSWAYDNLDTAAGRTQASEDLYGGKEIIEWEIQRYTMAKTTLNFYKDNTEATLSGLEEKALQIQKESAYELAEKRDALQQKFQVTQNSLARSFALRNQYASLLPLPTNNIFKLLA